MVDSNIMGTIVPKCLRKFAQIADRCLLNVLKERPTMTEVAIFANVDHLNLEKLLGYVEKGNEHLVITEYMPNGTLKEHLDGVHGSFLDFSRRLEICIDIARGLTHLHRKKANYPQKRENFQYSSNQRNESES